jgi:hypothetical protein
VINDPITLWFYRGALGAVSLLCVGAFILLIARTVAIRGTAAHEAGEAGLIAYWIKNQKTYTVVVGLIAAIVYDKMQTGGPLDVKGIFTALALAALRAAIGKNQKTNQQALDMASDAASIATQTQAAIRQSLKGAVTPLSVQAVNADIPAKEVLHGR